MAQIDFTPMTKFVEGMTKGKLLNEQRKRQEKLDTIEMYKNMAAAGYDVEGDDTMVFDGRTFKKTSPDAEYLKAMRLFEGKEKLKKKYQKTLERIEDETRAKDKSLDQLAKEARAKDKPLDQQFTEAATGEAGRQAGKPAIKDDTPNATSRTREFEEFYYGELKPKLRGSEPYKAAYWDYHFKSKQKTADGLDASGDGDDEPNFGVVRANYDQWRKDNPKKAIITNFETYKNYVYTKPKVINLIEPALDSLVPRSDFGKYMMLKSAPKKRAAIVKWLKMRERERNSFRKKHMEPEDFVRAEGFVLSYLGLTIQPKAMTRLQGILDFLKAQFPETSREDIAEMIEMVAERDYVMSMDEAQEWRLEKYKGPGRRPR